MSHSVFVGKVTCGIKLNFTFILQDTRAPKYLKDALCIKNFSFDSLSFILTYCTTSTRMYQDIKTNTQLCAMPHYGDKTTAHSY